MRQKRRFKSSWSVCELLRVQMQEKSARIMRPGGRDIERKEKQQGKSVIYGFL